MDKELLKHLTLCFDKPPEEAVEYLKSKKIKVTWNWQERLQAIKEHSFTVSKASSADVLQLFKDELVKSVETGTTFNDFKKSIKEKLKTAGFSKNADGKAWQLDTIYRTNTQTAYMAGRYLQQKEVEETFPYWKFIAVLDNRTTDVCSGLHNKVVKASDSFWDTHTPPLHYGCRSRTIAVDDDYLKKNNLKVSDGGKLAKQYPTAKGFDNNPVEAWKPDLSKYDKEIKNELGKVLNNKPKSEDDIRKERLFSNCSKEEFEQDWNTDEREALQELIGYNRRLSKKQITEIFGGRDDIDFGQIVVEASYHRDGYIEGVNIRSMKGTGRDGTFDRKFIFSKGYVEHSYYKLYDTGKDSYKQAFINQLDFYEYLGKDKFNKITLHANIDVGCWAWGRYGFKLNGDSDFLQYTTSKIIKEFKIRKNADKTDVVNMFSKDKYFYIAAKEFCQKFNIDIEEFKEKVVSKHIDWFGYFNLNDSEQQQIGREYAKKKK